MINYLPNDPLALTSLPMRQQAARANRAANRAGFTYVSPAPVEAAYAPGTREFLFWQSREAALAALEAWETVAPALTRWAGRGANPRKLALLPNEGNDLNAFYDGQSLSFFEHTAGGKQTFSGASTDVVAHEAGHALLDAIRPDLWDSTFTETGAFHEAFGDCVAVLTALSDKDTRVKLLQVTPDLGKANFVEATAEDLSDGVRRDPNYGPGHSASAPRHSLNNFQWKLPTLLPADGGPSVLISEIHSFGRIFSGCFYDLVRHFFAASAAKDEAALLAAAQMAGKLLVAGTKQAQDVPRFFQSVGRAMVLADQTLNGGGNREAIGSAFGGHSISLGTNAMLAPRAALAGAAPKFTAKKAVLGAETIKDIKRRMDLPSKAHLEVGMVNFGDQKVAKALHVKKVSLAKLGKEFKNVVAYVPQQVMVGASNKFAALVSPVPEPYTTEDEVETFVATLLKHGQLDMGKKTGVIAATNKPLKKHATHRLATRGNLRVIERVRFVCHPHGLAGCGCLGH